MGPLAAVMVDVGLNLLLNTLALITSRWQQLVAVLLLIITNWKLEEEEEQEAQNMFLKLVTQDLALHLKLKQQEEEGGILIGNELFKTIKLIDIHYQLQGEFSWSSHA